MIAANPHQWGAEYRTILREQYQLDYQLTDYKNLMAWKEAFYEGETPEEAAKEQAVKYGSLSEEGSN